MVDENVGKRFGDCKQVEVLSRDDKKPNAHNFKYSVVCHTCAKDPELFGSGIFHMSIRDLTLGKLPCGCSKSPKMSQKQWAVRAKRECDKRGYEFLGFKEWAGQNTKIILKCPEHGIWDTGNLGSLLAGRGCPSCGVELRAKNKITPTEKMISRFMETGAFKLDTYFWKLEPNGRVWSYVCPECSYDEYVQAGKCSGIFTADRANLMAGKSSCRCGTAYRWSTVQREFQIDKAISEGEVAYKFVGWNSGLGYKTQSDMCTFYCPDHGNWSASIGSFIDNGSRCPSCAGHGYDKEKPGFIYVLLVKGQHDFCGYGITNHVQHRGRLYTHALKLRKKGFTIDSQKIFETDGAIAPIIEKSVKQTFECFPQEVEGFKTEATYPHLYHDVVNFVEAAVNNT